jgi:hypothetical protein
MMAMSGLFGYRILACTVQLLACQSCGTEAQGSGREWFAGLAQRGKVYLTDSEKMTRETVGIDQKIVHGTEFHLVGVLIDAGKDLRQERRKHFSLERFGESMGNDQPFLKRDDGTGNLRQSGQVADDFRW